MIVFFDTNVLIYAAVGQRTEPHKCVRATALVAEGGYATSGQIHAEFYSVVTSRKYSMPHAEALAWLDDLARFPVVPLTAALVAHGARLADRYRISYWHGAIVAAAQEIGAETLFSEDLNAGQVFGSIRVVNPFAQSAMRELQP